MGINILIVDDDKLLVKKLEETVDWERIGISMVFTAFNIRQAQKLLTEYPIELLLCDIDMPQGSGLELLVWIREKGLSVECVFLSSYANFAYAQMALQLSSKEYLLKPISNADLEKSLERLTEEIARKKQDVRQEQLSGNEQFWKEFSGMGIPEERMLEAALHKQLYRNGDRIALELLRFFGNESAISYRKEIFLYDFIIRNIAGEFFKEACWRLEAVVHQSDLEWMLVLREADNAKEADTDIWLRSAMLDFKGHLDVAVSRWYCLYVGSPHHFLETAKGWRKLEYIAKHAVPGETGIFREEETNLPSLSDTAAREACLSAAAWSKWERELRWSEDICEVGEEIIIFVEEKCREGCWDVTLQTQFVQRVVRMLYKYMDEMSLNFRQLFEAAEFAEQERAACTTIKGIREFIRYSTEKLEGNRQTRNHQENVVDQLKEYIEKHLSEELSRVVLAKTVFLSEDYVSRMFVKQTGMSIPSYIAERRIERAKELLANSAEPVSRVAMEVGYHNFSYFSKTFRELAGCTPNEYRSRLAKI